MLLSMFALEQAFTRAVRNDRLTFFPEHFFVRQLFITLRTHHRFRVVIVMPTAAPSRLVTTLISRLITGQSFGCPATSKHVDTRLTLVED